MPWQSRFHTSVSARKEPSICAQAGRLIGPRRACLLQRRRAPHWASQSLLAAKTQGASQGIAELECCKDAGLGRLLCVPVHLILLAQAPACLQRGAACCHKCRGAADTALLLHDAANATALPLWQCMGHSIHTISSPLPADRQDASLDET